MLVQSDTTRLVEILLLVLLVRPSCWPTLVQVVARALLSTLYNLPMLLLEAKTIRHVNNPCDISINRAEPFRIIPNHGIFDNY